MAVQLLFPPKWRSLDADGNPLAGGKLYSYEAGTSTPLATYTTRAGNIANANPVVLDANGEADIWGTPGVDYKLELRDADGVVQWTVDNIPTAEEVESETSDVVTTDPGGRLSLTSGEPVTITNITDAATVYYVPFKHNKVPLYDGSNWSLHSIATELSQAASDNTKSPSAVVAGYNYDMFIWDDDGTLRLSRGPVWSSNVLRGTGAGTTELERVDGRWVNKVSISNGPGAQRGLYVGTVRSGAGAALINDSQALRHVWNCHNRVARTLLALDTTNQWSFVGTGGFRQANNSTANQLDILVGLIEEPVSAKVLATASHAAPHIQLFAGIGINSTSTNSAKLCIPASSLEQTEVDPAPIYEQNPVLLAAEWSDYVSSVGRHYITWLEGATNGAVPLFYGDRGAPTTTQSGIIGQMMA